METEQRTEKQAPCEIIPASQTFRPKYDLKKHGKIDGRKNKIRKKAETKEGVSRSGYFECKITLN